MLKSLQQILAVATVVKGDVVLGDVDRIEITEAGVYIVLDDETPDGPDDGSDEEQDIAAQLDRIGERLKAVKS